MHSNQLNNCLLMTRRNTWTLCINTLKQKQPGCKKGHSQGKRINLTHIFMTRLVTTRTDTRMRPRSMLSWVLHIVYIVNPRRYIILWTYMLTQRYYWNIWLDVSINYIFVTRSGKTDHVCATSEMHFVAPYHRYIHALSKHSDKITRGGQVCFSTWLFLGHAKHWKEERLLPIVRLIINQSINQSINRFHCFIGSKNIKQLHQVDRAQ